MSSAQVMTGHATAIAEPQVITIQDESSMEQDSGQQEENELVPFLTKSGDVYQFDCSVKTCTPKGFLSGERVLTPKGPATVVGVNGGFLWFRMDGDKGASYWNNGCTHEDLLRLGIQQLHPNEAYDPKKQFRGLKRPNPKNTLSYVPSAEGQKGVNKEIDALKAEISRLKGFELESMDFHELEQLERASREYHEKIRAALVERLEDKMKNYMCVVCMDAPYNVCCLPCGHVSLCVACSFKIGIGGQCPTCRKTIDQLSKVYLTSS